MKKEPIFTYIDGQTTCVLHDGTIGIAKCHPDDMDMANARTGQEIAYRRAEINAYKKYKDNILIFFISIIFLKYYLHYIL